MVPAPDSLAGEITIGADCLATITNCGRLFSSFPARQYSVADDEPAHPKGTRI